MQINFLYTHKYELLLNGKRRRSKFIAINVAIETVYTILYFYAVRSFILALIFAYVWLCAVLCYSILFVRDGMSRFMMILIWCSIENQPKIKLLKQTTIFLEVLKCKFPHSASKLTIWRFFLFLNEIATAALGTHSVNLKRWYKIRYQNIFFFFLLLLFTQSLPHSYSICILFF